MSGTLTYWCTRCATLMGADVVDTHTCSAGRIPPVDAELQVTFVP
jgi:hypothetical protein